MSKLFYSVAEVADMLGENPSCIRYWSDTFSAYVKPSRTGSKGTRQFRESDIEALRRIKYLLQVDGMTIDGARKRLAAGSDRVERDRRILDTLKQIRRQLLEIKQLL